jgi:hypothetical protein
MRSLWLRGRDQKDSFAHPPGHAQVDFGEAIEMRMGATHFLMKRLPKVAPEMALHVLAYNLTRVTNIQHASNLHTPSVRITRSVGSKYVPIYEFQHVSIRRRPLWLRRNGLEQARLLEVGGCPADAVVQPRLPASEKLCSVVVGQPLDRFGKGMLLTVTRQLQQRKHQGLEVRDSHIVHLPELRPEVLPPTPFTEARPSPSP